MSFLDNQDVSGHLERRVEALSEDVALLEAKLRWLSIGLLGLAVLFGFAVIAVVLILTLM
jgi:hypothetical protein